MDQAESDRAERIVKRRAVAAWILGLLLIVTQQQRMDGSENSLAGWSIGAIAVSVFLIWAGGWFRPRAIRAVINDESSALHRYRAITIGFWTMLAAAVICFCLSYIKAYGPRDAIQIVATCGISASLISFGTWERIALTR